MKIIHALLGKANPDRMNGVNKVVHALASQQHALGYDVSIWGITRQPMSAIYPRDFETRLFQDHGAVHALDIKLKAAIYELPANTIFHLHGGFNLALFKLSRLLQGQGVPYFFTPHGAYNRVAMQRSKWSKRIYIALFERQLAQGAAGIQLIGASEVAATQKLFTKANTLLIPNGQDQAPLLPFERDTTRQEGPVFGCLGRLDMHTKGLDLLLKGFADYLHVCQHQGTLLLIGDGPDRAQLQNLARQLGIEAQVQFCGPRYGDEKWKALNDLDVLVQASRNEGLPGAVLEAAASKVPALVSIESNMGDYVTRYDAGLCLPHNNAGQITQALCRFRSFWGSNRLPQMRDNALRMVQTEFNWATIARRLSVHYQETVQAC